MTVEEPKEIGQLTEEQQPLIPPQPEEQPEPAAEEPVIKAEEKAVPQPEKPQEKVQERPEKSRKPYMSDQYMVVPAKSFFWTMILFCIPVLGQFVCLIMTLGGSRYRNKVNFARACFLMMLLQAALLAGLYFLAMYSWEAVVTSINQFLVNTGVGYPSDWTQLDQWVKQLQEVPSVHEYLQTLNAQAGQ